LDVGKNTALTELHCGDNPVTSLDVSKCPKLKTLNVSYCKLLSKLYYNYDKVNVVAYDCDALFPPIPDSVSMRNSDMMRKLMFNKN
jgi:Leucine-rich repeat (LRR) protein